MKVRLVIASLLALATCACGGNARGQTRPDRFELGFWSWGGTFGDPATASFEPELVYTRVGGISAPELSPQSLRRDGWRVYGELPHRFPPAQEYWLAYRYERQGAPSPSVAESLARNISELWSQANSRHIHTAGVQLDIDSPTASLKEYAEFLGEVRKRLPRDCQLSVTALLDWFRPGTDVGAVMKQIDEFTPQFYDIAPPERLDREAAIAAPVDGAYWGPIFNRFGKRFRIGISTFGRVHAVAGPRSKWVYPPQHSSHFGPEYADLTPLDLAVNPAFQLRARRNEAGELILDYTALRDPRISQGHIGAGDSVEFIAPSVESVRAAVESARKIGGHCGGVVFFRWPEKNETLTLQPDEVFVAAGVKGAAPEAAGIAPLDGHCALVKCVDLFLTSATPWDPAEQRYRVRASRELDYFLPEWTGVVKMTGPAELQVTLPPYTGRSHLLLGRVVSKDAVKFAVEVAR